MKLNPKYFILIAAIGIITLIAGSGGTYLNAQEPEPLQDGLVEDWLDDFENCEDWRAVATSPIGETKTRKIPGKPRPVDRDGNPINEQGDPGEFSDEFVDENGFTRRNDYVLGVKTYFSDRGFDRVEVFPPNEYIIRGKARELKVWVLGRKQRHDLYVKLRDYRGRIHKLKMGNLDFWGWRELTVIIPGWLPQSSSYALLDQNLQFVSFFAVSDRFERPGTFYFYLDQFRVITDLSEFTGDETIQDTW